MAMSDVLDVGIRSIHRLLGRVYRMGLQDVAVVVGVLTLLATLLTAIFGRSVPGAVVPLALGAGVIGTVLVHQARSRSRYRGDEIVEDEQRLFGVDWVFRHRGALPIAPYVPHCPDCQHELDVVDGANVSYKTVYAPEAVLRCPALGCRFRRETGVPRMIFVEEVRQELAAKLRQLRLRWLF
jgi:hypothetical protein